MKQCSILCAGWWPLVLLPILFMIPLLLFKWEAIETDVANNTVQALSSENLNWANVQTVNRGRHVLITGTPPDLDSVELARQVASSAVGVDKVSISTDVKPPATPAQLDINISGNKITLRGVLSSQEEITRVVANATSSFGAQNVDNRLEIGADTAEMQSLLGLFQTVKEKANGTPELTANISGNTLLLKGEVGNANIKRDIINNIERVFKGRIDNQLRIAPPPPPKVSCEDLVKEALASGSINFQTGKAAIKQDSFALLDRIKLTIEGCQNVRFEIGGHTDSSGSLNFNMKLSELRAAAVVNHLVELGLDSSRFSSTGYGPNQPIADNATAEGRAQNRRIEFRVVK